MPRQWSSSWSRRVAGVIILALIGLGKGGSTS